MKTNEKLRDEIFEIIKNQLEAKNPPETFEAYQRLQKQGIDDLNIKKMIGQCLSIEIFEALKFGKPYNNDRYIRNLNSLPKEPSDKI